MVMTPTHITCERCGDETAKVPPSTAWIGRHAHGMASVAYRAHWTTAPTTRRETEPETDRPKEGDE